TSGQAQINCGGPAASSYLADVDFSGGGTITHANSIDTSEVLNPAPVSVYQTARVGNFSYTLPGFDQGSSNLIRLHFAETYWTSSGKRSFNVSINGTQVLTNFDVFVAAGGKNRAVVKEFILAPDVNGSYAIQFTAVKDQSLVSAIEIAP